MQCMNWQSWLRVAMFVSEGIPKASVRGQFFANVQQGCTQRTRGGVGGWGKTLPLLNSALLNFVVDMRRKIKLLKIRKKNAVDKICYFRNSMQKLSVIKF